MYASCIYIDTFILIPHKYEIGGNQRGLFWLICITSWSYDWWSRLLQFLRCNNGTGGFDENLLTFWGTKFPGFYGLKRCASKNAVFRYNTKRRVAETPHRFDSHRTKIGPNPNFFAYSKSPWTEEKYSYKVLRIKYRCFMYILSTLSSFL